MIRNSGVYVTEARLRQIALRVYDVYICLYFTQEKYTYTRTAEVNCINYHGQMFRKQIDTSCDNVRINSDTFAPIVIRQFTLYT